MNVTIDDVRTYWDDRPCNVKHSKKEIGTKEYFDEVERKRYTAEPHIPSFAGFSDTNGKKVLEVGCGTGQFWTENYKHIDEKSDLTLTDFSEGMIEKIKSKINHSNIKFEIADIEQLSYDDNTFDLVMAHHVIYHSSDKDKAISELKRVTKPGGTISITSNSEKHMLNVYTFSHSIDNNYSMVRNIDGFTEEDADKILPSHFQTYQKEIYEDLLKVTDSDFMLEYIKSTTEPRKMD